MSVGGIEADSLDAFVAVEGFDIVEEVEGD